jgi:catechol 2,3-dioxygenase-like lactoylglutathione lyase family enzyme
VPEATELFAGVPVRDRDAAFAWYERLLGAPPDLRPHDDEAVWRVAGGWIYVVVDAARAGRALVTVLVDDLDGHLAQLAGRGLAAARVETYGSGARKAVLVDPDGNEIGFGEAGQAG